MENLNTQKVICMFEGLIFLVGIKTLLGAIGLDWAYMPIEHPAYSDLLSQIAGWTLDIILFIIGFVLIIRAVKSSFWLGYFVDIMVIVGCGCFICLYKDSMVILPAVTIALGACLDMYRIYSAVGFNDGLGYLWRKDNFLK